MFSVAYVCCFDAIYVDTKHDFIGFRNIKDVINKALINCEGDTISDYFIPSSCFQIMKRRKKQCMKNLLLQCSSHFIHFILLCPFVLKFYMHPN